MRLIDANALMERFAEMQKMGKTDGTEYACSFMSAGQEPSAEWYTIEDAVDNAPTVDAVPVVRCKDCKWFGLAGCAIQIVDDTDKPSEDDFCSFGERKGGDE